MPELVLICGLQPKRTERDQPEAGGTPQRQRQSRRSEENGPSYADFTSARISRITPATSGATIQMSDAVP